MSGYSSMLSQWQLLLFFNNDLHAYGRTYVISPKWQLIDSQRMIVLNPSQSKYPSKNIQGAWRFSACSNPISRPLPLKVSACKVLCQCRQALISSHNNCTILYTILHKSFSVYIIYIIGIRDNKNVSNS